MTDRPVKLSDVLLALFAGVVMIGGTIGMVRMGMHLPVGPMTIAPAVVAGAALALRRRWPLITLAVAVLALLWFWLMYGHGIIFLAPIIALYTAVNTGHRKAAWIAAAVIYVGLTATSYLPGGPEPVDLTRGSFFLGWTLMVMTVSELVRIRRERITEHARVTEEEERRQKSEERLRIARELHDVLGHNISLINVQAGTALHLIDDHPEQARTALAAIKEASKEVLDEMRSVLAVLREEAPREPTAGLDRLSALAEKTPLDVSITGSAGPLPAGVDLAAYRIVQEALTNVTKHSLAVAATVRLARADGRLEITVEDAGPARDPEPVSRGGDGLRGMRERAEALEGTLEAGPRREGFRVRAVLPIPETT